MTTLQAPLVGGLLPDIVQTSPSPVLYLDDNSRKMMN